MENKESYGCHRRKATDEMREKAKQLEEQAANWRCLADALDEIERYASKGSDGEEGGPHIGVGSQAEAFLWALACGYS
jgi:hypothetical protein